MGIAISKFLGPSYLASALINGDSSSLESLADRRGLRWLEAWIATSYGAGAQVVDCADAGFRRNMSPDVTAPRAGLRTMPALWVGGDTQLYTVLIP
jgi:hypothetical protein